MKTPCMLDPFVGPLGPDDVPCTSGTPGFPGGNPGGPGGQHGAEVGAVVLPVGRLPRVMREPAPLRA